MTRPRVMTFILNWNGHADTINCVRSVLAGNYANNEVIIIDNGSTDGSDHILREEFPDIQVIQTGRNLGFGGGMNVGIRFAMSKGAEYVWLLNNDLEVDGSCLREMVATAERSDRISATGCVVFGLSDSSRVLAWGGGRVRPGWRGRQICRAGRLDYVTGASMLLLVPALRKVGIFDEAFFMYYEDVDLCIRLRNHGYRLAVAGNARVFHREGARVDPLRRLPWLDAGTLRLIERYGRFPKLQAIAVTVARTTYRTLKGRTAEARVAWKVWKSRRNRGLNV